MLRLLESLFILNLFFIKKACLFWRNFLWKVLFELFDMTVTEPTLSTDLTPEPSSQDH